MQQDQNSTGQGNRGRSRRNAFSTARPVTARPIQDQYKTSTRPMQYSAIETEGIQIQPMHQFCRNPHCAVHEPCECGFCIGPADDRPWPGEP